MKNICKDCGKSFESKCEWLTICHKCVMTSLNQDKKQSQGWAWQEGYYNVYTEIEEHRNGWSNED